MAEKLDLHLLELARAEGEVSRRDFVAETLADLGDAEGHRDAAAVADVFEIDEYPLGRLGPKEDCPLFAAESARSRLEHQVEFTRCRQRAERFGVRRERLVEVLDFDFGQRNEGSVPLEIGDILGAQIEELERPLLRRLFAFLAPLLDRDEHPLPLGLDPSAADLVVAIALLGFLAIDHEIMEQIVMAGAFPDLRVHDDRTIQPDHLVGGGRPVHRTEIVMARHHIAPPGLLDVALQLDAQRSIIPEAIDAAIDFARLKQEAATFAERDDLIHRHNLRS